MDVKYNRFAIIPTVCSVCGRTFWMEPFNRLTEDCFSPLGGYRIVTTNLCKECKEIKHEHTRDS